VILISFFGAVAALAAAYGAGRFHQYLIHRRKKEHRHEQR